MVSMNVVASWTVTTYKRSALISGVGGDGLGDAYGRYNKILADHLDGWVPLG